VSRNIFGTKRDEVTGEWIRLHNVEFYCLYISPHIIWVSKSKKNEMDGACGTYGGQGRCTQGFGGET
jgi:hypothetical protein